MEDAQNGLLLSLLAGGATALGALALPCLPPGGPPPGVMAFALSLAAGVMIAISLEMLFPHGRSMTLWSALLFGTSFCVFAGVCALSDRLERQRLPSSPCAGVPMCAAGAEAEPAELTEAQQQRRSVRLAMLLLVSLTLHNIPEGFAVAISTVSNRRFGINVAIAVALHNIPEGLSLAVATYDATKSRFQATLVPALAGCAEPFGAALALFAMRAIITEQLVHDLLVVVAGVMCYLAFGELLPAAASTGCWGYTAAGCFIGLCVMLATHEILDHAGGGH